MTPCVRTEVVDGTAFTYVNGVRGTLNAEDARVLVERACTLPRGARYAETGSYLGCSALLIALHAPAATVWAHDLWVRDWSELPTASEPPPSSSDYFFKFYGAVRANGLENRVIPVRGESAWTLGIHAAQSVAQAATRRGDARPRLRSGIGGRRRGADLLRRAERGRQSHTRDLGNADRPRAALNWWNRRTGSAITSGRARCFFLPHAVLDIDLVQCGMAYCTCIGMCLILWALWRLMRGSC